MIAALILAAGGSRRLGQPKQLVPWGGTTLLGHVVERARSYPVAEVWVVLGAAAEEVLARVDLAGCGLIENPEWQEGMASSLRAGLDALTRRPEVEAVLVLLGDQPDVPDEVVEALVAEYRAGKAEAVVPKYRYTWGNPVVVGRRLWPRIMSMEGDEGAKQLLQAHPEWVTEVWFPGLPPGDVDTVADLEDLRPRG
ncbi:MAG: nucleotidyltransferase family protein [Acidimicrobiia bacterium]